MGSRIQLAARGLCSAIYPPCSLPTSSLHAQALTGIFPERGSESHSLLREANAR